MAAFLIGAIGAFVGLFGWYHSGSIACLIIGSIAYIIETIVDEENLTPSARVDVFKAFGIGALIALLRRVNHWAIGGMIGINIWGGILTLIGLYTYIRIFICFLKKK